LNSSKMTEAGSLDLIDEDGENSDLEDRIDNTLPGSRKGGDLSTRKLRPEVRVTSVEFSPTATAFAAASTEGLLIYSVDDSVFFDPFDLDVDVTPQSTIEALEEKEYLNALVMSFRLNEEYLVNKVYENIPLSEISLVAGGVPEVYLAKLLTFIGNFALESQHIEFNLIWIKSILAAHGHYINLHKHLFATPMRAIQRFIGRIAKEVASLSTENKYTYRFLTSTDGTVVQEDDEDEALSNHEDSVEEEDAVMQSDDDDEEGWVGFEGKDNKLQLENEDESSDEELI